MKLTKTESSVLSYIASKVEEIKPEMVSSGILQSLLDKKLVEVVNGLVKAIEKVDEPIYVIRDYNDGEVFFRGTEAECKEWWWEQISMQSEIGGYEYVKDGEGLPDQIPILTFADSLVTEKRDHIISLQEAEKLVKYFNEIDPDEYKVGDFVDKSIKIAGSDIDSEMANNEIIHHILCVVFGCMGVS